MKKFILFAIITLCSFMSNAQLTTLADGGSVTINYGRPAVKGREGKIWGGLVYNGFQNLGPGYGSGNDAPWRAGANENTTIEFSTDVMIEGHQLQSGKYGLFIAYGPASCTLIFSSNTSSWGSYFYDKKEDVLRVNVKPVIRTESRERLSYEFSNETDSSATISLVWEKLALPFNVSTKLQQLQLASFDKELRGEKGFDPHALLQAADYMQEHNIRLNEALTYADNAAMSMPTFGALMTKGQILEKLNRQAQADSIMKAALEIGSAQEIHNYARSLLGEKKTQKAFDVFQYNYKRHPNTFTTNVGMSRGYAAIGNKKDAIKYANLALATAPDPASKKSVETMIRALMEGRDI